eukprot:m.398949 g.398949  ORF g.398949 m.398949 type:complete len:204 (-) comp28376_c0_seq1:6487-7098(-)
MMPSSAKQRGQRTAAQQSDTASEAHGQESDEESKESERVALNATEKRDLAGIFHLVDRSGTGVLDWMELRRCLRGLGFPISKKEARDFVREKCRVDGFVKLRHFYEIVDELGSAKRDALREMKYGFRLFTGTEASIRSAACITEADLRRATVSAHISADIPAMLAIADVDGDGKVGKADFIQVMSRTALFANDMVAKSTGINV